MSDRLTILQAYGNPQEAEFARGLLESHGIAVFLADEHIARLGTYMPIGGVRLQVRECDLEDARQILHDTLSDSTPVDEPIDECSCPICGGQRSRTLSDPLRSVLGLLLLGIPFLFVGAKRRCEICGNVWRGRAH